jgi:hypothetical protein
MTEKALTHRQDCAMHSRPCLVAESHVIIHFLQTGIKLNFMGYLQPLAFLIRAVRSYGSDNNDRKKPILLRPPLPALSLCQIPAPVHPSPNPNM